MAAKSALGWVGVPRSRMCRAKTAKNGSTCRDRPHLDPFLLRPLHLAPQLRAKSGPQLLGLAGQVEHNRDLAVRHRKVERQRDPASQLEQLDVAFISQRCSAIGHSRIASGAPSGPP